MTAKHTDKQSMSHEWGVKKKYSCAKVTTGINVIVT